MSIKEILQDYALQELEEQIIMSFDGPFSKHHDYTDERILLQVRRDIINSNSGTTGVNFCSPWSWRRKGLALGGLLCRSRASLVGQR